MPPLGNWYYLLFTGLFVLITGGLLLDFSFLVQLFGRMNLASQVLLHV